MKKSILIKFASVVLVLAMLSLSLVSCTTKTVAEGTCGDKATWTLSSDGELRISGSGAIYSFADWAYEDNDSLPEAPWASRRKAVRSLVIEDGITGIGAKAFQGLVNLKSVSLPYGITEIPNYAFTDCYSLKEVVIPGSVIFIGSMAFCSCTSLSSVILPTNLSYIGYSAFFHCAKLKSIELTSKQLSVIDAYAFAGCPLSEITIPSGVYYIGNCAFMDCKRLSGATIGGSGWMMRDSFGNVTEDMDSVWKNPEVAAAYLATSPFCEYYYYTSAYVNATKSSK